MIEWAFDRNGPAVWTEKRTRIDEVTGMLVRNMKLSEFTLSSGALRCRSARTAVSPSFQSASPDRVQDWIARNAGHTTAYDVHPAEWEARLVSFLDHGIDSAFRSSAGGSARKRRLLVGAAGFEPATSTV